MTRQSEINRNQSRQRVLRVAALITEGYDYTQACDKLGYRKDALSRAKKKFIRLGDEQIENAFKLTPTSMGFFLKVARGEDVGPCSRGKIDSSRQSVRKLGLVKSVGAGGNRKWVITDAGREFYEGLESIRVEAK